jgi:hypothetical protein
MRRILTGPRLSVVFGLLIAACTARPGSEASPISPPPAVTPPPTGALVTASATATEPLAAGPPAAALAAEGGDPVDGQLGTYTWGASGSDSPWLHGARIAVGSNEPLDVRFGPAIDVVSWLARYVPATADGPAGAVVLGEGTDEPRFEAPEPGTWTVELHVTFANDLGHASYFWQLAVD